MWCRRRESNDTRLLILRNLLQTYERQNRTTRCMPAFYVQNHVQRNRALRRCSSTLRTPVFWRSHQTASHPQCVISALYGAENCTLFSITSYVGWKRSNSECGATKTMKMTEP